MWYHLILSDITYNQDDITLKLDDIIFYYMIRNFG